MRLYCELFTLIDWVIHGPPVISGHDFKTILDFDEFTGRGTLRCRRCGAESLGW